MQQITPNYDSVFTQDYWGELPKLPPFMHSNAVGRAFELNRLIGFHWGGISKPVEASIGDALARTRGAYVCARGRSNTHRHRQNVIADRYVGPSLLLLNTGLERPHEK